MCNSVYELSRLDLFLDNLNSEDLEKWEPLIKRIYIKHIYY